MEWYVWVAIITGGLFANGIIAKIYDDVFEQRFWRYIAVIPYSLFLYVMLMIWGLVLLLCLSAVFTPFQLFYEGVRHLLEKR